MTDDRKPPPTRLPEQAQPPEGAADRVRRLTGAVAAALEEDSGRHETVDDVHPLGAGGKLDPVALWKRRMKIAKVVGIGLGALAAVAGTLIVQGQVVYYKLRERALEESAKHDKQVEKKIDLGNRQTAAGYEAQVEHSVGFEDRTESRLAAIEAQLKRLAVKQGANPRRVLPPPPPRPKPLPRDLATAAAQVSRAAPQAPVILPLPTPVDAAAP